MRAFWEKGSRRWREKKKKTKSFVLTFIQLEVTPIFSERMPPDEESKWTEYYVYVWDSSKNPKIEVGKILTIDW